MKYLKDRPGYRPAKFILTALWGVNGLQLLDLIPSKCRFNAEDFVKHVMAPLVQTVFPQGRTVILLGSMFISTTAVFTSQK
jgi:hypothetical protein